ncbi:hypothetical protein [Thiobacillus denitrificans]|uniref:hypothetical protein n=1 Tax=Thiobacillus denitrificans TaxID=36861 RepID=UPI0011D0D689|nr:hypothetical protein [Thiobacillus denitrificans]
MTDISILQERLERAKRALREEKKRQREREQQRVFEAVRRSGLSLTDLETMLAAHAVPPSVSGADGGQS